MDVISIGTDRKIFESGSAARARMIEYGALFHELHIIIFSKKKHNFKYEQISPNIWIYPTSSWSKFLYIKDAYRKARSIIEQKNFTKSHTVITCQDPFETGRVGVLLKKKLDFALQIQIHTDFLSPYFKKESLLNKIRITLAKQTLQCADEIRVVSKRIKQSLSKLAIQENRIDVLPIFTDSQKYLYSEIDSQKNLKKKYSQFETIILMASRLTHEKNISFALSVFKEVLHTHPKVGLVIVGEGPEKSKLIKQAQKLHIDKSVVFESWQKNLKPYYEICDIFLLTSLYEGYGLTLVEAGLSGTAIVTSDVGIAGELLHGGVNSCICRVGDKQSFIHALDTLISEKILREKYSQHIKQDMQNALLASGTKESYVQQYVALIKKALIYHLS